MFYYIPAEDRAYEIMKDWQDTTPFAHDVPQYASLERPHDGAVCLSSYVPGLLYRILQRDAKFQLGHRRYADVFDFVLSFTGYLLPWDQLAFWAITVGTNIAGYVPNLPGFEYNVNRVMLLASTHVGQDALIRFYVLHVAFLAFIDRHFDRSPFLAHPQRWRLVAASG